MVGIFKNRIVGIGSEYCGMMQCQRSRLHTQRQLYTENKASEDRSYSGVCVMNMLHMKRQLTP